MKIGKELGIKIKLTTYVARYSFANSLCLNGATLLEIQQMMGHEDIATTRDYLVSLGVDTLRIASQKLSLDY